MTHVSAIFAPLLGIYVDLDGTFFVQVLAFWAILLFVHFALVRPYLDVVEEREQGIGGSREDAREMDRRADQLEEEFDEKMQQARREAQEVRESLRNQGKQEQKENIEEVREELKAKLEGERESIRSKVDEARSELEARSRELASAMVEKIVPGT